ncbi:amino acid ABC transporter permease [Limobrevibacterium gyesilva]
MAFTLWDILRNLLLAARWTVLLSIVGFVCGGSLGVLLLMLRVGPNRVLRTAVALHVEVFQGTPLLMQLFLVFFGLPLVGVDVEPWLVAGLALTLSASAYLTEIWRGCVEAIPLGQWDAAASLGLHRLQQLRLVILPQALRIAVAPTVGFFVQLVKSTALTSIIGFDELLKTANVINNATFEPFTVYGVVALIYFALCFPLSSCARLLERRLQGSGGLAT